MDPTCFRDLSSSWYSDVLCSQTTSKRPKEQKPPGAIIARLEATQSTDNMLKSYDDQGIDLVEITHENEQEEK
eukprot:TRINITY_DN16118_c0_g1_i1.p1 TRINITY_DN16118_c0_g1~~TRINITY_DN16118_c0_g1_i1.p1  ORF type:complete len:73 (+),score=11.23 TRINITY_DN16118_c0_g1_i1:112-330(+)